MRPLFALTLFVLCFLIGIGCEPDEEYHARILGGRLRALQKRSREAAHDVAFQPTNYYYNVGTTNQYFVFTNQISVGGVQYKCQFGIRDPRRFQKPGILAITEDGVLLWISDEGKIVVGPDRSVPGRD